MTYNALIKTEKKFYARAGKLNDIAQKITQDIDVLSVLFRDISGIQPGLGNPLLELSGYVKMEPMTPEDIDRRIYGL
jgi:hypothetical protein